MTQNAEIHFKGILRILSIFIGHFFKKKFMEQSQSDFFRLKELCERDAESSDKSITSQMHSDTKKLDSFLALLFATGDLRR